MIKTLETPSGAVKLPAFFPDATYGAIRAGSFEDVHNARLQGCRCVTPAAMRLPCLFTIFPCF